MSFVPTTRFDVRTNMRNTLMILVPLFIVATVCSICSAQVATRAGNGKAGFADGRGEAARFNEPFGACLDKQGNVYVADAGNNRIRRITPDGTVSTYAGSGERGTKDGPAAKAQFNMPSEIVFDPDGNLLVVSYIENCIRKISPDGVVSSIIESRPGGYVDGPLKDARIRSPRGVAVDSKGNILFSDCWNHRIRKITPQGVVSTLAGGGSTGTGGEAQCKDGQGEAARLTAPCGMVIDTDDNLYVADANNHRIRKITPEGMVTTIAGSGPVGKDGAGYVDGPAAESRLNTPTELFRTDDGTIYFSDTYNSRIRKIDTAGVVSTIAGTAEAGYRDGPTQQALLNWPRGIVVRGGEIVFVDYKNNALRTVKLR